MKTLDSPVYEVKQDSEWYASTVKRNKDIDEFFKKVNAEYFKDNGFVFYHSEWFGVLADSEDFKTYQNELLKKPEKNGVHIFKKRSKYFNIFKEMIEQIEKNNPFKPHDELGMNNISGSQWVGDRWFFGAKHEQYVKGDDVAPIDYKDYLEVVMSTLK